MGCARSEDMERRCNSLFDVLEQLRQPGIAFFASDRRIAKAKLADDAGCAKLGRRFVKKLFRQRDFCDERCPPKCASCDAVCTGLKCSRCLEVRYCSKECQK